MGAISIWHWLIILLVILVPGAAAFLVFAIKPNGPNRFGGVPAPAGFGEAVGICFRKFADFNGRAARSEFWWFYLATVLINIAAIILNRMVPLGLGLILPLVLLIPTWAAGARRLHDINRSGWWQLLGLTLLGGIMLFVLFVQPSQSNDQASVF
ncbi:DUF805 domain-containing protein [Asticcacaulis sp. 201]|uniref:DUF805 domain-containing protein n=1 Tax=Asticcacaulis sp. 201 TaxID=3028787 RepID=UPI002915F908|nr:DUF805 domain-containing protein [Asticcacaulis sp. 201]MDV6333187.1 DUF805 domain-containing protein [Asticcacaulis sp. 201]